MSYQCYVNVATRSSIPTFSNAPLRTPLSLPGIELYDTVLVSDVLRGEPVHPTTHVSYRVKMKDVDAHLDMKEFSVSDSFSLTNNSLFRVFYLHSSVHFDRDNRVEIIVKLSKKRLNKIHVLYTFCNKNKKFFRKILDIKI